MQCSNPKSSPQQLWAVQQNSLTAMSQMDFSLNSEISAEADCDSAEPQI